MAAVEAALAFYGGLFDWTFAETTPPGAPYGHHVAELDGLEVAGIAGPAEPGTGPPVASAWRTSVAVDDADAAAARVEASGGRVVVAPADAGGDGRAATCTDPTGVPFRLWQARGRLGAQVVNAPGAWNFSDLHTDTPAAVGSYADVFGWSVDDLGFGSLIRVPGYGDHLAATCDPGIHARQATVGAPPGFADAIGWVAPLGPDEAPHWHVCIAVADRDETVALARRLGGTVLEVTDTDWTRIALLRDPQGAVLTVSEFSRS